MVVALSFQCWPQFCVIQLRPFWLLSLFYGGFLFSFQLCGKVELMLLSSSFFTSWRKPCLRLCLWRISIINPQNPLDDFYSLDSLKEYLEFAKRYNLHVIIDEIYMLSVLDEHENVLGMESLSDLNNTHVINQSAPIRISASLALAWVLCIPTTRRWAQPWALQHFWHHPGQAMLAAPAQETNWKSVSAH